MCGRFSLTAGDRDIAAEWDVQVPFDIPPRYNIAPTQPVVALLDDGERRVEQFQWGLIPHWAKAPKIGAKMINARAETLFDKPAFRVPARRQRCLVLADGFYEWQKSNGGPKVPHYVRLKSGRPFGFAGLWETWQPDEDAESLFSCTIVTTEPNELMTPIHNRMPVIVRKDLEDVWLDPELRDPETLRTVLRPYPDEELAAYPVSTRVNKPANDRPECIEPVSG